MNIFKSKLEDSYDNLNLSAANNSRANLALTIGLVACLFMLFSKDTEVIALPCSMNDSIVMEGNKVNKEFKIQWALSIVTMLANINDKNSNFITQRIVSLIPPELNPTEVESTIISAIEEMKLRGTRENFVAKDIIYSTLTDYTWVVGEKTTVSLRSGAEDTSAWTYEVRIGMRSGHPKLLDIQQFPGTVNPVRREKELLQLDVNSELNGSEIIKYSSKPGVQA